jgi:hypothetical protein
LLLGNADTEQSGVYAKLAKQDSIVLVKSEAPDQVRKTVFDLRKRNILDFTQEAIEKMQFVYADDAALLVEKRGEVWKAREPEKADLTTYKLTNLLYDLENLEFTAELLEPETDLSVYGLEPAEIEVTLWEKGNDQEIRLLLGKSADEEAALYVKVAEESTVYMIDPAFLDELPRSIADLNE